MNRKEIKYHDMFWLFMAGNLLGVIIEGIWCLYMYGRWETHVVTIWGPFCLIYGVGAVVLYAGGVLLKDKNAAIRFGAIALVCTVIELLCGLLLEYGLGMRAWDYSEEFMNFKGHICLSMTLIWGVIGLLFARFVIPKLDKMFAKMQGKAWRTICVTLSAFMVINMAATTVCMMRWKARHDGHPAGNKVERLVDALYDDNTMSMRFCEWRFIDRQE